MRCLFDGIFDDAINDVIAIISNEKNMAKV